MVSPLGRVQGLLQLLTAAARWHRRVQHRQLWLAGQEDMGALGSATTLVLALHRQVTCREEG